MTCLLLNFAILYSLDRHLLGFLQLVARARGRLWEESWGFAKKPKRMHAWIRCITLNAWLKTTTMQGAEHDEAKKKELGPLG